MFFVKTITLSPKPFGFHIITDEILNELDEIKNIKKGICFLNLLHTSAALTINENADPTVRSDFKKFILKLVPRNFPFDHYLEGDDDMPAHILSSLIGTQLQIPIVNGKFVLGTWQGIYLCEFREHIGSRKIHVTILYE
ncbi:MAG: thiamin phosphate synthase [Leptospiraceae bacterium]|nr:MAG: thiamin phosphate synthase [Leptospiraceae bacterium]